MKIGFGCDHAAIDLKNELIEYMTANDTQQYSLTEDGIQLLSWVTEVEIYE